MRQLPMASDDLLASEKQITGGYKNGLLSSRLALSCSLLQSPSSSLGILSGPCTLAYVSLALSITVSLYLLLSRYPLWSMLSRALA
jgi:hypothetical protein